MAPAIQPSARTWILRFKNGRTTILLHVDPTQKLDSIKQELLNAARQTNPSGQLNGVAIPDSLEDVIFGKAVDVSDHSKGWEPLEKDDDDEEMEDRKGKGKAAAGKGKAKKASDHTPSGLGLQDQGTVAFKFKELTSSGEMKDDWVVVEPTYEETYAEDKMEVQ